MCWHLREDRGHSLSREGEAQGLSSGVRGRLDMVILWAWCFASSKPSEEEVHRSWLLLILKEQHILQNVQTDTPYATEIDLTSVFSSLPLPSLQTTCSTSKAATVSLHASPFFILTLALLGRIKLLKWGKWESGWPHMDQSQCAMCVLPCFFLVEIHTVLSLYQVLNMNILTRFLLRSLFQGDST